MNTTTDMQTLAAFIAAHQITMHAETTRNNPHMPDEPGHPMDHWFCTFTNANGSRMAVHFSTGRGLRKPYDGAPNIPNFDIWSGSRLRSEHPTKLRAEYEAAKARQLVPVAPSCEDVMDCLASDACGIKNARNFADWCAEYGYDEDSRKAEKTYLACQAQHQQLRAFLNAAAFSALLFNTERL